MMSARHVVVTGAASGIGAAVCESFRLDGDRVTAVDLREPRNHVGEFVQGDLADAAFAGGVVSTAWERQGPVDLVVAAAGIYPATPFVEMTAEVWDRVQAVNVRAPMLLVKELGRLVAGAGRTACAVLISSGAANRARPGAAHYCASKAALEMLTRAAALELGQHGIRVNAVSPGFVDVASQVNPVTEDYATRVSVNPLGRRGQPADIVRAIRWLASSDASWITGTTVRVDGGASAGNLQLPLHWADATEVQTGNEAPL
ncbi:MAG: SDR family oxidoreductase [Streptosporangiales bacterium]|nr:SDR family oxidoreductase [Streptosporangiales bacterium]